MVRFRAKPTSAYVAQISKSSPKRSIPVIINGKVGARFGQCGDDSQLTASTTWISQTDGFNLIVYLQAVISVLLATVLWSGIWAAANRILGAARGLSPSVCGRLRYGRLAALVRDRCGDRFYVFMEWLSRYTSHIEILVLAIAIYFHLSTIKRRHTRGLLMTTLFCAAIGSGLVLMTHQKNTGMLADELYMGDLFAPVCILRVMMKSIISSNRLISSRPKWISERSRRCQALN